MRQPLRLTLSALALLALAPAVLSLSLRDASEPLSLRDAASSAAQAGVPATTGLSSLTRDKWIGLALAISSSLAIGTSFIITKKVRSRRRERRHARRASLHVQQRRAGANWRRCVAACPAACRHASARQAPRCQPAAAIAAA
jgi:hypothetical protein